MKSFNYILALLVIFCLSACESDNNIPLNENTEQAETNPFLANFGADIQARFIGTVVNEQNNPISGVEIRVGNTFTTTDSNGVFSVLDATVYEKFAYIKASKAGFVDGSRALVPTSGVNQVKIMLLSLEPTAIITPTAGQELTIDLPDGTEVVLPGMFQDEFGQPYLNGDVEVTVKGLNVDDENMQLQMPGMLLAENTEGSLRALETYGMISVELRGINGQELNLVDGFPATIRVPIGTNVTNPPATIPLWFFDEANGYWKEEGFAELINGKYEGSVNHFSFWNCDAPFDTVDFCVTIVDQNNSPIPNIQVQLEREISGWSSITSGITDENGLVCGLAPANEALTLIVPDFGCVANDFSTNLGPYSEGQNITVTVQNSSSSTTNFTATFNDCNGDAITNGYLQLFYNNDSQIIPITNGMISQVIDYCESDTSFSAQAVNLNSSQSTAVVNGNFTTPTTDLGSDMSCVDLSDTDGDGVLDIDEDINGNNNLDDDDTDGDGTPDYQDEDDDGDGVNTTNEDYNNDGNPMNEDSDGDGIPDYLDEQDVIDYASEIFADNCDVNNLEYDLTETNGATYPNTTFTYHETQADADANNNPIMNPSNYINTNMLQQVFVRATNTISNQSSVGFVLLIGIEYLDSDADGLSDCEELTGVDDGSFANNCNPNGNITDPNDADSDDDGFNDCLEANNGTNPNDINDFPLGVPVANNDEGTGSIGLPVVINILNDNGNGEDFVANGTLDASTVTITIITANDTTGDGDNDTFVATGQGIWTLDESANLTFTPEASFTGTTSPLTYTVEDNNGNISNEAVVSITFM